MVLFNVRRYVSSTQKHHFPSYLFITNNAKLFQPVSPLKTLNEISKLALLCMSLFTVLNYLGYCIISHIDCLADCHNLICQVDLLLVNMNLSSYFLHSSFSPFRGHRAQYYYNCFDEKHSIILRTRKFICGRALE